MKKSREERENALYERIAKRFEIELGVFGLFVIRKLVREIDKRRFQNREAQKPLPWQTTLRETLNDEGLCGDVRESAKKVLGYIFNLRKAWAKFKRTARARKDARGRALREVAPPISVVTDPSGQLRINL